ncbi:uncharacterized protein LOC134661850 [Cydia amplana]|uniref:uncharacterized protein LOC134661850 n=1 Tax=Cydia amplana TaxID=1869771 RepID=UPI002FE51C3D
MRKYCKDCKVIPGEPLTTQHRLLVTCLQYPAGNLRKRTRPTPRVKWHNLDKPQGDEVRIAVETYLKSPDSIGSDPNETWNNLHERVLKSAKQHLGITRGKPLTTKETGWWNDEVKSKLKEKKVNFKTWQSTHTEEDRKKYVESKTQAKKLVACSRASFREDFYKRLENATNDKDIFKLSKYRNSQTKDIKSNKYIKDKDGRLITKDKEINIRWQEYYSTLLNEEFPRERMSESINYIAGPIEAITPQEVKNAITRAKNNKSMGPDEIPTELWKKLGDTGVTWLANFFTTIIESGRMPNMWRNKTFDDLQDQLSQWCNRLESKGIRISRKKTEYMYCNLSGSSVDRPSPLVDNVPINKVTKFKYLGSIITSDLNTQADIENRIQAGWQKWRALTGVLCDARMPIQVKGNVYKRAVRPALLYGAECWPMRKEEEHVMHCTEMRMLRWAGGVTLMDRVRNNHIRGTFRVAPIAEKMCESRLRWFGHVMRRDDHHMTKRALNDIPEIRRGRGRPPTTWMSTVSKDLRTIGASPDMTQNREEWRKMIRRADPKP